MKKGHQRKLLPEIVSVYITTIILLKTYYYYLDMLRSKSTFKLFLSYIFRNFLQIRIKTRLIKKDWSLCDQNLQFVAILHKKWKNFVFIFLNFDSSFYQTFSIAIFYWTEAFQPYQIYQIFLLNVQKFQWPTK